VAEPKSPSETDRRGRLAAALRDNLKRRKAQARAKDQAKPQQAVPDFSAPKQEKKQEEQSD
jgi:hypothetical protein